MDELKAKIASIINETCSEDIHGQLMHVDEAAVQIMALIDQHIREECAEAVQTAILDLEADYD